ncbi:MAG: hypothetical protein JXR48_11115 [Candidatus Delongbacteria bacterium]|nr:hypothetical protein [Candidatus Delongbacteria bacterium]
MAKLATSKGVPINMGGLKSTSYLKMSTSVEDSRYPTDFGKTRSVFSGNMNMHSWKQIGNKYRVSSFNF